MGRMLLKGLIGIGISLCVLQNSWAISIDYLSGEIFASSSTNDSGSVFSAQQSGFTASGTAVVDTRGLVGGNAFGFASGFQTSPLGSNNILFTLTTTAEQANESGDSIAHETSATVSTEDNPDGRINYRLSPEAGEEGDGAQLTITAALDGSLISNRGLLGFEPPATLLFSDPGHAQVDFEFHVYADIDGDGTQEEVATFSSSVAFALDTSGLQTDGSVSLPGNLGAPVVITGLKVGDDFSVSFKQTGWAQTFDEASSARAFGIQSNSDIFTVAMGATPASEPSTLLLFGTGVIVLWFLYGRQRHGKV